MKLYEEIEAFASLFDDFDNICDYEPEKNELGEYIDPGGNVIKDIQEYRRELEEAWFDTLDGMEEKIECKLENLAAYRKEVNAEAQALKDEENSLKLRRKVKEHKVERIDNYILLSMQTIGRAKLDKPKAKISLRTNAESVHISDENKFITLCEKTGMDDYLRYKAPEINKTAVKKALQSGVVIEGAELQRTQSLIIK